MIRTDCLCMESPWTVGDLRMRIRARADASIMRSCSSLKQVCVHLKLECPCTRASVMKPVFRMRSHAFARTLNYIQLHNIIQRINSLNHNISIIIKIKIIKSYYWKCSNGRFGCGLAGVQEWSQCQMLRG